MPLSNGAPWYEKCILSKIISPLGLCIGRKPPKRELKRVNYYNSLLHKEDTNKTHIKRGHYTKAILEEISFSQP